MIGVRMTERNKVKAHGAVKKIVKADRWFAAECRVQVAKDKVARKAVQVEALAGAKAEAEIVMMTTTNSLFFLA